MAADGGASGGDAILAAAIERVFRAEHGRAVAVLVRAFGDVDLAEEAVADAFAAAVEHWSRDGLPPSPAGWVITTARNKAIDRFRKDATRAARHAEVADQGPNERSEELSVDDDELRLIFTCCHPALNRQAQVALTLRLVAGLTTPEIARAFLVSEATLAQRLVRAKAKIRAARIPFRVPEAPELPPRLKAVLAVVYLAFNEGYAASRGPGLTRADLTAEAIRLARELVRLLPDEPEVVGLLALMLLAESRRTARTAADGSFIPLAEQNRQLWNRVLVDEGQRLVRACLVRNAPGPYQIQAAIQAVHADASSVAQTDWGQVVALYDQLLQLDPSPVAALNRAIAVAEVEGPAKGLELVEALELSSYYLLHAVRADLLGRLGRGAEAMRAYRRAIEATENDAERAWLHRCRAALQKRDTTR